MKAYFIGIGGIGVSAIAQYYLKQGWQVSGSDLEDSEILQFLREKGVKIYIGKQKKENIAKDIDLVIYSSAVQKNNLELKQAYKFQVPSSKFQVMSYPEALGRLTKEYFTIAITGTHGKSTTTTMLGLLLTKAGLDPTVIVGTIVKEFGNSNFRIGKSKYLVIEACEYKESFLNYSPDIAVITNIEPDHLDYYKNFNNIKKAFTKFAKQLKKNGILITEKEYKNLKDAKKLKKILKVPGEHNISNALTALAVARTLKISDKISFQALSEYSGCWRRFEVKEFQVSLNCEAITGSGATGSRFKFQVISDYAHHPTEVKATLKAVKEKYPNKKICSIFQPHQYHRTYNFFDNFVETFKTAFIDKIIITDIYDVAGREDKKIKEKVSSQKLVKAINKSEVIYLPKEKIIDYLENNVSKIDVLVIMGAGDIYKIIDRLKKLAGGLTPRK